MAARLRCCWSVIFIVTGLLSSCATTTPAPAASAPSPGAAAPSASAVTVATAVPQNDEPDESVGMKLDAGIVAMSGGTELTCRMRQDADDRVRLILTIRPACATTGSLDVLVRTTQAVVTGTVPRPLEEQERRDIEDGPPFPLPPEGTVIRTRLTATCTGTDARKIWATAHCTVPRRKR
jgi:hypothetical protein